MGNSEESKNNKNKSLNLIDIISIFLKNKKGILLFGGIALVVSVVLYFLVFDLIYTSTATVKSSGKASGLLGGLDLGLDEIGGIDEIGLGGGKTAKELANYEEILYSRKCLEPLIIKFGLMEREDYKYMEDALKEFREEKMKITMDNVSGVMKISVLDKDKVMAKDMVEFLLDQLNSINIELNVANAKNNREFIEKRYLLSKEELRNAEDSLKAFQQIYGIAPDLQIKASAQSLFTLEAELKSEEVKLDVIKKILSSNEPEVKVQEAKVNSLKNKISEIQVSTDLGEFLRLGNSPQIAQSYIRLSRDVEIQNKILAFILPIYEQAKIEEKRETPTVLVLDKPFVADRKTKPKRATMVIIITILGLFTGLGYYIIKDKIIELKEEIKNR